MPEHWHVSDHHFGHGAIIRYQREGDFRDLDHMHEELIARHNRVVAPRDFVDFHGDVGGGVELLARILPRMNGRKRLIPGNHDDLDYGVYAKYFDEVFIQGWRQWGFKELGCGLVCTHFPLHEDSLLHRYKGRCLNAHGHTHRANVKRPGTQIDDPRYFNLSVEVIDYTPVHRDTLIEMAKALA